MSTVDNIKMYLHVTVTRVEHTVQMMYWGSSWCILHLSLFWCTLIWMYQDLESKTDIGNKSTFFLYRFICCFIQGIRRNLWSFWRIWFWKQNPLCDIYNNKYNTVHQYFILFHYIIPVFDSSVRSFSRWIGNILEWLVRMQ